MTRHAPAAALLGAILFLGTAVGAAGAMPAAPAGIDAATLGVEQAAYLHRRYPGYHSPAARAFRHARRFSPNRFCRKQPSRCR